MLATLLSSCGKTPAASSSAAPDPQLAAHGSVEVMARLVEIPEGAIFKKDLYNYTTILKYEVLKVHRGALTGDGAIAYLFILQDLAPTLITGKHSHFTQ